MKATEQYFSTILQCFMLYEVVLTLGSVDENLSITNESYWAVLSCGTVYYAFIQGGSNFWVCGWNPTCHIQMDATERYFPVVLFIILYKVALTFGPMDEILKYDHWNESYSAVPFIMLYQVTEILKRNHPNESYS